MIEQVKIYRTSDGETFDDRAKAERHEAAIKVEAWLDAHLEGNNAELAAEMVAAIIADPEAARVVFAPLMPVKRPRGPGKAPRKRRDGKPAAEVAKAYEDLLGDAA